MRIPFVLVSLIYLTHQVNLSVDMTAKELSSTIAKFSAKFCNELEKDKSAVSSPLSAEVLLALITLGTTEPAHSELLTSLGLDSDDTIRSSFYSVSTKLKSISGITLNIANKVYVKEGDYDLAPKLKEDAVKVFDADFEKVNFGDGAAASQLINKWVESKTNERIKDLISSDSINDDTRLVLVNALYFKGSWAKSFDPQNTMDKPFHVNSNTTVNVPMMYKQADYRYWDSEDLQAQFLELPYQGNEASMLIVLPKEIEGLNGLLQKLADGYDLLGEVDKMWSTKVEVTIPKFKIETEIDLKELLPKLGIKAIFDRQGSGLTKILNNNEPLFVSKAVQKAFIEVNEEGTEAAAATAMGIMFCSAMVDFNPVPSFVADRPYLFAVLVDGTPYFMGTHNGDKE